MIHIAQVNTWLGLNVKQEHIHPWQRLEKSRDKIWYIAKDWRKKI